MPEEGHPVLPGQLQHRSALRAPRKAGVQHQHRALCEARIRAAQQVGVHLVLEGRRQVATPARLGAGPIVAHRREQRSPDAIRLEPHSPQTRRQGAGDRALAARHPSRHDHEHRAGSIRILGLTHARRF
jgi:hypothetical protein